MEDSKGEDFYDEEEYRTGDSFGDSELNVTEMITENHRPAHNSRIFKV